MKRHDEGEDDWPCADHAQFMPPWREILPGLGLGPLYGPRTEGALDRLSKEYEEGRAGGGLWDTEVETTMAIRNTGRAPHSEAKVLERHDAETMRRFVERHSVDIPERELEVYFGFYRDMLSKGQLATRMGISKHSVCNVLQRLRLRQKGLALGSPPVVE